MGIGGVSSLLAAAWLVLLGAAVAGEAERVDFAAQVAPLLSERCLTCHNPSQPEGGLDLSTVKSATKGGDSGPAVVPGRPEESALLDRITPAADGTADMPKKGPPLAAAQVDLIRRWIAEGAAWPESLSIKEPALASKSWWSFQPVQRPAPPDPPGLPAEWSVNSIDRFIYAKLRSSGLSPAPPADRRTLIRRLYFNLIGLPPAPDEVEQFVQDPDPAAYDRLVDRLLASPHYGERWARHWLDVVRFAESNGFEMNQERPNAWPYRDYVIRALNEDKPYDRFIQEQLAGDVLGEDAATGFLVGGPWDQVKSPDPVLTANQRADELHDMVSTTGSALLGLTLGCARCHSHKFDPIPQTDYYAVKAILAGVQHGERPLKAAEDSQRQAKATELKQELDAVEQQLRRFQPLAYPAATLWLDDAAADPAGDGPPVRQLVPPAGTADYRPGTGRGEASDPGDGRRLPTIGRGYTWWANPRERDVFMWSPRREGHHRVWLSWGCGWSSHATDARYVLDRDGSPETREDQQVIATVDQRKFSDGSGDVPGQSLWSGFFDAGVQTLTRESVVILRGGSTDAPVTADALVFQAELPGEEAEPAACPQLRMPVTHGTNIERFASVEARFVRFTVLGTAQSQPCIDELEIFTAEERPRNVALASAGAKATASSTLPGFDIHRLENIHDGRYGNSHSWISNEPGAGWVAIELARPERIEQVVWSRDREPAPRYTDRVATAYRVEVSPDGQAWQTVASHDDRLPRDLPNLPAAILTRRGLPADQAQLSQQLAERRQAIQHQLAGLTASPLVYAGKFGPPEVTYRLNRGDPTQPREPVAPGSLTEFGEPFTLPAETPDAERRLALAKWITRPDHPLTARVIVNRLWHYQFGTGIVHTPSDLGVNGGRPSHPELLDWLAAELMQPAVPDAPAGTDAAASPATAASPHAWSLKHIQRLICRSAAYRQSSQPNPQGLAADAAARLLWRYPPRRLEAETLRDTILSVSGKLDLSMGGPGFDLFEPNTNYVRVYTTKREYGADTFRRMVYQRKPRMQLDDTFGAFDCPDAGQIAPQRNRSNTPLQALNLLNSAFLLQQAEFWAQRLAAEAGEDPAAQARLAFRLAFSREPLAEEQESAVQLIREHGRLVFCRAMVNANEFLFVY